MNSSIKTRQSINTINEYLKDFERKIQKKVLRQGLKKLGATIKGRVVAGLGKVRSKRLKNGTKTKIKVYKRGKIMWLGVGFLLDKNSDAEWQTRVMAFCYEGGFRPYPKGKPHQGKGKGWRSGIRRAGGTKVHQTNFISNARQTLETDGQQMLHDNVVQAISELK